MRRPVGVALAVGLLGWLLVGPALAHAYLVSTDPPDGTTVSEAPTEIRLEFSEPVGTDFAQVQVTGPAGTRVDVGDPVVDGGTVTQQLGPLGTPGVHTFSYRVVSADGHPIEGTLTFDFAPPDEPQEEAPPDGPPPDDPPDDPVDDGLAASLEQASPAVERALVAARLVNYLALAAVIGFLLAAVWILGGAGARSQATWLAGTAAVVWLLSALVLFVLALANAAALPVSEALDGERLAAFAQTRFGGVVLGQALLAGLVAAFALGPWPGAVRAALVGAGLGALAPGLWGHAATADLPLVALAADWIHVLGAGAWVGGLAALVALASRESGLTSAASRFSRVAGFAILAVGASGVVHLVLHTDDLADVTGTGWGRLALAKMGLLVVLGGFGWVHRRRTLPKLGAGPSAAFRRFAGAELLVMVVAVGLAATMASGMPAGVEAAARIKSLAGPFADGHLNLVVDPGVPGPNEVHLYFFGPDGLPQPVEEPSVTFEGDASIPARLSVAGPGHFVDPRLDVPAGSYRVVVTGMVDGQHERATATVTLP